VRLLLWSALTLLLAGLVLLGLLAATLATEPGSRYALQLLQRAVPGISISESRGNGLGGLALDRFSYADADVEVTLTELRLRLDWRALLVGQLRLPQLQARTLLVRLFDGGEDSSDDTLVRVATPLPLVAPALAIDQLTIDTGGEPLQLTALRASVGWLGTRLRFADAEARLDRWRASATGVIRLRGHYPLELDGRIDDVDGDEALAPIMVRSWGDLQRLGLELHSDGEWPLSLTGSLWLLEEQLRLQFVAQQTRPLQWGEGRATLGLQAATLTARGTLDRIDGELHATLTQPDYGEMPLQAQLAWQGDTLRIAPLLTIGDGALDGRCTLLLGGAFPLQCDGELRQLALAPLGIDATLSTPFALVLSDPLLPALQLQLPQIGGTLFGRPLQGAVELASTDGQQWQIDRFDLRSGDNRAAISGQFGDDSALQLRLDAPALAQLDPLLAGALDLRAELTGALAAPNLSMQIEGAELGYDGYTVGQLQGSLAIREGARSASQLRLRAAALQLPGLPALDLNLRGSGLLGDHRLQLAAAAGDATLQLACGGSAEPAPARGRLRCDTLEGTLPLPRNALDWQTDRTLAFDWQTAPTRLTLAPFCLRADGASLCLRQPLALRDGKLAPFSIDGEALPLRWARGWLPGQLRPAADSVANLQLSLERSAPLRLQGRIELPASTWRLRTEDGRRSLPLAPAHLSLQLDERQAVLEGRLAIIDLGALALQATIDDPGRTRRLGGSLRLEGLQLGAFGSAIDGIALHSGELNGRLDLRGTLADPALTGNLALRDGELLIDMVADPISALSLDAWFDRRSATLHGSYRSGSGGGVIGGSAQWPTGEPWQARLTLTGNALRLAPLPGSELTLDAQLALDASAARSALTGDVRVTQAEIRLDELPPETVSVSSDAVVIGRDSEPSTLDRLAIDLGINAGNRFHFSGFGADTHLTGNLRVTRQPGQTLRADGTVRLVDGRYRAYGQRLLVRRGSFLFTGPLDNPTLDIEAIRELAPVVGYDDVEVGLQITGTLRDPLARIFSRPSMPESNAVYYLLTGRPPPEGTTGTEFSAGGTLLSLGLLGGEAQAAKLAERFGISDLQISTTQGENGAQAEVSGYLAKRLYVRYGAGLDKQGNTVTFQYQLTKRLVIEALSGLNDALDLIYTFTID
jgi:translocation and assembly module TamB